MNLQRLFTTFICMSALLLVIGCSGGNSLVTPETQGDSLDSAPMANLSNPTDISTSIGLMGAYEFTINPVDKSAELTLKRSSSIGESYLVSGLSYFTISPCGDCLIIKGLKWESWGIEVMFEARHPFDKGNIAEPPTAKNRLDLDVFDLSLVVVPLDGIPTNYPNLSTDIYNEICLNPDGYTSDLGTVAGNQSAMPYYLVIDDSDTGTNTWNKFEMETSTTFNANFSSKTSMFRFDLYLTMGYGWSATWEHRLEPQYFNPEFNKKSAWKVEASQLDYWLETDNTTEIDVEVRVYDWQIGAAVDPLLLNPSSVFASSEVSQISVEIPGMNTSGQGTAGNNSIGGTGTPNDPLIYHIPIANENLLPAGLYTGLVKVTDDRVPMAVPPTGDRDFLVNTDDGGANLEYISLPEYATYQTFTASVVDDSGWAKTWGGPEYDISKGMVYDDLGNLYVAGTFIQTADFDPNPNSEVYRTANGAQDIFLSKFDPMGNYLWVKTWGSTYSAFVSGIIINDAGDILVLGNFTETVDFDPSPTESNIKTSNGYDDCFLSSFDENGNHNDVLTWGGAEFDWAYGMDTDNLGNYFIGGSYYATVDFDPSPGGVDDHISNGFSDIFLLSLDSTFSFRWAKTWGGVDPDSCSAIDAKQPGIIYVTGKFESTVDFDPDPILVDHHMSNGNWDVFLTAFDTNGDFDKTVTWGGTSQEIGRDLATDSFGNIIVAGYFNNTVDFNPGAPVDSRTTNGINSDAFASWFDLNMSYIGVNTWGEEYSETCWEIAIDNSDNIIFTGSFGGTVDFDPSMGVTELTAADGQDIYVLKLSSTASFEWARGFGNTSNDEGRDVITDVSGNIFVCGSFGNTVDFSPDTWVPEWHTSNGETDAFLLKLLPNGDW